MASVDYEYERNSTASSFVIAEPLSGFRQATARERRTKEERAMEVAHTLDTRDADCKRVTLALDDLNTHTRWAFYEVFPADRRCRKRRSGSGPRRPIPNSAASTGNSASRTPA
jgi:hypothetical protein